MPFQLLILVSLPPSDSPALHLALSAEARLSCNAGSSGRYRGQLEACHIYQQPSFECTGRVYSYLNPVTAFAVTASHMLVLSGTSFWT